MQNICANKIFVVSLYRKIKARTIINIKNSKKMKDLFNKLAERKGDYSVSELRPIVDDLASQIVALEPYTIEVDKQWSGYGTWKSKGWVNKAYFGEELANIIVKALNGKITHDEDYEFELKDFEEAINERIYEYLY